MASKTSSETSSSKRSGQVKVIHDLSNFQTLSEFVIANLKEAILSHTLLPGTRLTEMALANDFDVSRIPVREAFKVLAEQGLIELRPYGRGAAVAEPCQEMLLEVYQVRAALELLSVELATQNITAEALEDLEINVELGLRAANSLDWHKATVLGSEFHEIISRGSGNSLLMELIKNYDEKLRWAHEPVSEHRGCALWKEHRSIFEALRSKNKQLAVKLMREHTNRSGESLVRHGLSENDEGDPQVVRRLVCL